MPTVSIIVPCYRHAHFLPVTLESVQCQTLASWECLIIDDGSPDATREVARSWISKDSRFKYFHKNNGGLSSARNFGLAQAKGRFIQFLDSDDVILPTKLQLQVSQLTDSPLHSLSFCDYFRGSHDDIYVQPKQPVPYLPPILEEVTSILELAADWETRLSIPAHCFLFGRVFFDEGIAFDANLPNHEDWDCWMQIFSKVEAVRYSADKLAIYRYHPESMCRNLTSMKQGYLQAIEKHLALATTTRELKAILRAKRAEISLHYERKLMQQHKWLSITHGIYKKIISFKQRAL